MELKGLTFIEHQPIFSAMIPRISLFIILAVTGFLVPAQVFVYEDFSEGQMPPAGWSISGVPQQWSISWSSLSSGYIPSKIPEGRFSFIHRFDCDFYISSFSS